MRSFSWTALFLIMAFQFDTLASELPGDSIYQIGSLWVNQEGKETKLSDLRGKPTILSMVYLSCEFLCPTIISEVQSLQKQLPAKIRDLTQIVLVSFDPEKDTPTTMGAYAKKRNLEPEHWSLITNRNQKKIRELATALGFKYQKIEKGDFTHSFMILVIDEEGVPKARVDSANQDKAVLIEALKKMNSFRR